MPRDSDIIGDKELEIISMLEELGYKKSLEVVKKLFSRREFKTMHRIVNTFVVRYLGYNDHGRMHALIVMQRAIEIFHILREAGIEPNIVKYKIGDRDDSLATILLAAFFHDVGNVVHRDEHRLHSIYLTKDRIKEIIDDVYRYESEDKRMALRFHVLNAIYAHDEKVQAFTMEASILKVADGCDITEGRSRKPYNLGKVDIHSISALAVKSLKITKGKSPNKPVRIEIDLYNPAGVFQIEEILGKKLESSLLKNLVEIHVTIEGKEIKLSKFTPPGIQTYP